MWKGVRNLTAVHLGPQVGKWGPPGPASHETINLNLTQRTHNHQGNQSPSCAGLLKIFISHFFENFLWKITGCWKKPTQNSTAYSLLTIVMGCIWFLGVQSQIYSSYCRSQPNSTQAETSDWFELLKFNDSGWSGRENMKVHTDIWLPIIAVNLSNWLLQSKTATKVSLSK